MFSPVRHQSPTTNHQSPITNHQRPITNDQRPTTNHQSKGAVLFTRTAALVALASVATLAFAACGDNGDAEPTAPPTTPSAEATAAPPTPAASPTADAGEGPTGVRVVNDAIRLMTASDYQGVEELFQFQSVACAIDVMGAGGPPECEANEADGAEVEVLPIAQCEGAFVRPQDIFFAQRLRGQMTTFHTFFNAPADLYPEGDYVVLFAYIRPEMPDQTLALELMMDDEGVTGINFGCGEDPATLIKNQGLTNGVVGPAPSPTAAP